MSIKVMTKVWESEEVSDQAELLMLLAMADCADDDGYCFPSVRKLAKKSRISERQAHRIIKSLYDKHWVQLVEKGGVRNGVNVSNRYRILLFSGGTVTMSPHSADTVTPRSVPMASPEGVTQLCQTIRHLEPSKKTTKIVVASSLASEEDEPREIVDKLTGEFGLSIPQGREIEIYIAEAGAAYVIEKAKLTRSTPCKNMAGMFLRALKENWHPRVSNIKPKPVKQSRPDVSAPSFNPEEWEKQRVMARAELTALRARINA